MLITTDKEIKKAIDKAFSVGMIMGTLRSMNELDELNATAFMPGIKDVQFHDPATIVFWDDDTKTVVKTQNGEPFDKEKGLAMAFIKKVFGNSSSYYKMFLRFCEDEVKE